MDILNAISSEQVSKMQREIEEMGWTLQYSLPPSAINDDTSFSQLQQTTPLTKSSPTGTTEKSFWQPPYPDGVDVILNHMFTIAGSWNISTI